MTVLSVLSVVKSSVSNENTLSVLFYVSDGYYTGVEHFLSCDDSF